MAAAFIKIAGGIEGVKAAYLEVITGEEIRSSDLCVGAFVAIGCQYGELASHGRWAMTINYEVWC